MIQYAQHEQLEETHKLPPVVEVIPLVSPTITELFQDANELLKRKSWEGWARLCLSANLLDMNEQIPLEVYPENLKMLQRRTAEKFQSLLEYFENLATFEHRRPLRSEANMLFGEAEDFVTDLKQTRFSVSETKSGLRYLSDQFKDFPYPKQQDPSFTPLPP